MSATTEIRGKTVLVRLSLDNGVSETGADIVRRLAESGACVAVVSGLGNPAGDINPALSLKKYAVTLEEMTGCSTRFISETVGTGAEAALAGLSEGEVAVMENLRFHPEERRAERTFAMRLGILGDYFVDAGSPAPAGTGWQGALRTFLPEPEGFSQSDQTLEEA